MLMNEEIKVVVIVGKVSKSWRVLCIVGWYKMVMFDKIDDLKKVNIIFEEVIDFVDEDDEVEFMVDDDKMFINKDFIIIFGLFGVGKFMFVVKFFE